MVFFDTETSGVLPYKHEIIQIGAAAMVDGELVSEFEAKIRFDPDVADPDALEMNSYDPQEWAETAEHPEDVHKRFAEWAKQYQRLYVSNNGKKYRVCQMVAHNAAFDMEFYRRFLAKHNIQWGAFYFHPLCTMQLAMWLFDRKENRPTNYKLGTLCDFLGLEVEEDDAHDALADVRATAEVYRAMVLKRGNGKS